MNAHSTIFRGTRLIPPATLMIICGLISIHNGVDASWDLRNYHLYAPFALVDSRHNVDVAPAQVQSFLNPLLDLPFYALIVALNDRPRTVAFLMGLTQGINIWLMSLIAWRCLGAFDRPWRLGLTIIALTIGATGAGTVPLIGTTTGDLQVSIPVMAGLLAFLVGVERFRSSRRAALFQIFVAGSLLGMAVGLKPTMLCFAIGLAAAAWVFPVRFWPVALACLSVGGLVGGFVTGGPHALRLFRLFGNPMFPFFNSIFHSPYFESVSARDDRFLPPTAFDALIYPLKWATGVSGIVAEVPFRDARIAGALIAITLVAAIRLLTRNPRRLAEKGLSPIAQALLTFSAGSYVAWLFLFSIYRYLLPLEMLSGVIIILSLCLIARPLVVSILGLILVVLFWATSTPLEWGHAPFGTLYVDVQAPALPHNSLVAIVGSEPVAFVIPFMETSSTWISLVNNFLHPQQENLLVKRGRDILRAHGGPLFVLDAGASAGIMTSTLASYEIERTEEACAVVRSNIAPEYRLCPIRSRVEEK